ncbi:MAG: LCP family protein [Nostocaceae cyanobacterium]|nr:LCP family protein [Nostocaceae cyanobacterium]
MVKQVQRSQNHFQRQTKQGPPQRVKLKQKAPVSREFADSTSSVPSQLYYKLGLGIPKWLFWILSIVVGVTLSGLLVSSLALWTPLWSDIDQTDEELGWGGKDANNMRLPGELWSKLSQYKLTQPMNILILGIEPTVGTVDGSPESFAADSDTMLLVRLNPHEKTIRVLSIPRDTMIAIPEKGLTKVSQANAQGGPVLAARVVSRTLSNAPIHRYIRISTSGLRQLVDQLGGVEVFVPQPMVYKDVSGGFAINLVSGWQNLNSKQAEEFVRFRKADQGDLGRVQRQQALLLGLRDRLHSPTVLPKLPQIVRIMDKYVDTNLKREEMMALVNFALNLQRDNLEMTILPGIFSRLSKDPDSYWLDLTGKTKLLDDYAGVGIAGGNAQGRSLTSLKIAVQNAAKKPKLTQKVLNYFKKNGFSKVKAVEDWSDTQRQTQIIVQTGNRKVGEEIQQFLGLGQVQVLATGDLQSDITIQIGKDWE